MVLNEISPSIYQGFLMSGEKIKCFHGTNSTELKVLKSIQLVVLSKFFSQVFFCIMGTRYVTFPYTKFDNYPCLYF